MADAKQGPWQLPASGLVWRRRSVLWWVFVVNFVLGAMGALPAARSFITPLRHSLAAGSLTKASTRECSTSSHECQK